MEASIPMSRLLQCSNSGESSGVRPFPQNHPACTRRKSILVKRSRFPFETFTRPNSGLFTSKVWK